MDWWVRALHGYAAAGVAPDYISIQNEPDFYTSKWETCLFGATEGATMEGISVAGYGQALDAVSAAIEASGLATPPVLLGPETTGFQNNVVQQYMAGFDLQKVGGSLTLVLFNTGSKQHLVAVSLGGFPYGSLSIYRSSGDSERAALVTADADGNVVLPPRSIATLVYTP